MGKKSSRRNGKKSRKNSSCQSDNPTNGDKQYTENVKALEFEPLTEKQSDYTKKIKNNDLTFGTGPAGTGKSYIVAMLAAQSLVKDKSSKLIITRPAQEAGENLGHLPGELDEKFEPYFRPFRSILEHALGKGRVEYYIKTGRIEAIPMGYMRGMTFDNSWVVLDEAQNTTPVQMRLFLTRIGINSKVIVNGDYVGQVDIKGRSGLEYAVSKLTDIESIAICEFTTDDIVRSGLVQKIVERLAA